jgi:uncharacterized membrane protein YbaN (DUF454 family)
VLRALLVVAGTLSAAIGAVGIYLPVLPTTPFLLLAAACYVRSSERMCRWLFVQPLIRQQLHPILEKKALPRKVKIVSLLIAWTVLGLSALFLVESFTAKALLLCLAVVKTTVMFRIPTLQG